MHLAPDDPYLDIPPPKPSYGLAIGMMVVGAVFLLPFVLVSRSGGVFFSLQAFWSALLTVGWTFFLGVVFLLYGWRRLQEAKAWRSAYGDA